jgi:ABC-2 type transport system permease protein
MIEQIRIVFTAEVLRRVRSRPFLIGLIIGIIGVVSIVKLPAVIDQAFNGSNTIVLRGAPALTRPAKTLLKADFDVAQTLPPGPVNAAFLKAQHATAAFVLTRNANGLDVVVYAHDPGSMAPDTIRRDLLPLQLEFATRQSAAQVQLLLAIPVKIETVGSKFSSSAQADEARGVAYTLIFFLYILILFNSQLVTSSVAEEKTSRIAELLVASVDPSALLGGKILAGATLAVAQMFIWIAAAVLAGQSGGTGAAANPNDASTLFSASGLLDVITPGVVIAFVLFLVVGLLQISMIFAACASLITRTEDLGSVTAPLVMPVVAALFIAIATLGAPDSPWAVAVSYLPLLSPFVMFARIAVSDVPFWQVALSVAINVAALYLIAIAAGKVYRVGMLMYGRTPKFSQILAVIRS